MKNPTFPFPMIFLSLVLAAVSAPSIVHGQVLDTAGFPVFVGISYYILTTGSFTGFVSDKGFHQDGECPPSIYQARPRFNLGIPVTFAPQNPDVGIVQKSSNLTIEFNTDKWSCPDHSKVWQVVPSKSSFVRAGGDKGDETSLFRIEKDGDSSYKIVHSQSSKTLNIVTIIANVRTLAVGIGDDPLKVQFARALAPETNNLLKNTI